LLLACGAPLRKRLAETPALSFFAYLVSVASQGASKLAVDLTKDNVERAERCDEVCKRDICRRCVK